MDILILILLYAVQTFQKKYIQLQLKLQLQLKKLRLQLFHHLLAEVPKQEQVCVLYNFLNSFKNFML